VRLLAIAAAALLTSCESPPPAPPPDPTTQAWYREAVQQLVDMNRGAEGLFKGGDSDGAAALIEKEQPLVGRVLRAGRPTLEAAEAASDLDDLYGRMLLSNRHYAWARLMFQKNIARWKRWQPPTAESSRRFEQAKSAIEKCDRALDNEALGH
jgi:hypothetical protein